MFASMRPESVALGTGAGPVVRHCSIVLKTSGFAAAVAPVCPIWRMKNRYWRSSERSSACA